MHNAIWDDAYCPDSVNETEIFAWVGRTFPRPEDHDFILATDGSGCVEGWGAYCAILRPREDPRRRVAAAGTYGQTVQRCELTALLEGLYLAARVGAADMTVQESVTARGEQKFSVYWTTDRANLAKMLLTNEDGAPLNVLRTDGDLVARLRYLRRFFNITPMLRPRNEDSDQAICDSVCGMMRGHLKQIMRPLLGALQYSNLSTCPKLPQTGLRF